MGCVLVIALGKDQVPILQSLIDIKPEKSYLIKNKTLLEDQQDILNQLSNKFTDIIICDTFDYKDIFDKVNNIIETNSKSIVYLDGTTGTKSVLIGLMYASALYNPRNVKLVLRDIINLETPYIYSDLKSLPKPSITSISKFQRELLKIINDQFKSIRQLIINLSLEDNNINRKKINYNINSLEKQNLVETSKEQKEVMVKLTFLGSRYKKLKGNNK